MPEPIEVFFWLTPNAWKITIALEEMQIPYVIRPVPIGKGDQFRPDFLAISPNNKIPAIVDPLGPDGSPISLFESGAILQYLGRKTGEFYREDERGRASVDAWLFWQVGGVGPMFGQSSHFRLYAPNLVDDPAKIRYPTERYDSEVNRLLGVLDVRLDGRDYLADEYSIADMAVYPWASFAEKLGQDLNDFPRAHDWIRRMAARPAVQRGMAAGADLRWSQPAPGSAERREFEKTLFGQTAASVATAAADAATAP